VRSDTGGRERQIENPDSVSYLPAKMDSLALSIIANVYSEKFSIALQQAKELQKYSPERPEGFFFHAVVILQWMERYASTSKEDEFYKYCDKAIDRGRKLHALGQADGWSHFFMGGAQGLKGSYESWQQRWITAIKSAWTGVSTLRETQQYDSAIVDVNYGIGAYDYWRSAMMQTLWFLPKGDDNRQEGIEKLRIASENGRYTSLSAAAELIEVYENEQMYEQMLQQSLTLLEKFPNALQFHLGAAKSLFYLKRFDQCFTYTKKALMIAESDQTPNYDASITLRSLLAQMYVQQKKYQYALAECNRIDYYAISNELKSKLKKTLSVVKDIENECKKALKR